MIKLNNKKGFTLIELMIVIAIIGILAAIAIPNFIEYRNKSYCSRAESDANNIAAALSDYFSIPNHTTLPTGDAVTEKVVSVLSGDNTGDIRGTADAHHHHRHRWQRPLPAEIQRCHAGRYDRSQGRLERHHAHQVHARHELMLCEHPATIIPQSPDRAASGRT